MEKTIFFIHLKEKCGYVISCCMHDRTMELLIQEAGIPILKSDISKVECSMCRKGIEGVRALLKKKGG